MIKDISNVTYVPIVASSSQQPQEDPAYGSSRVKVTVLASEWGSSKGGLSTINRELAIQLAKCPEAEITFFLPQCSAEDKNVAISHNINIVEATRRPGFEELDWLSFPPEHLHIDVIVGHGVKLGHQAQVIRDSHKCKWIQVVHTDPEELGMFKSYLNPISKGEEKHNVEVELCQMADFVVGIGPKLTEAFRSYLRWCGKDQSIHDLTPGIFDEFQSLQQVSDERENCGILVFGRGDAEDFALKGFDIAGQAVASLPNTHLVFVGAPDGKHEEIASRLLECGIPRNRLKVRGYVNSRESLKHRFCEADLVLMPSRTEGFGLTGLEALSAGLPVVVSRNSGFGQALSKVPFGSSFVIDSEEPEVWATAIKEIWDKDRKKRLEEADALRTSYGKKYSWAKQSKDLFQKIIDLTHGPHVSFHQPSYNLRSLPNAESLMVKKAKECLLSSTDFQQLKESLIVLDIFISEACKGVIGNRELHIKVRRVCHNASGLEERSAVTIQDFSLKSKDVLQKLQSAYQHLLDGLEGMTNKTLLQVSKVAENMTDAASELHEAFDKIQLDECDALEATRVKMSSCSNGEAAINASITSLKSLLVTMMKAAFFWQVIKFECQSLAKGDILQLVERAMRYPEKKRIKVWASKAFAERALQNYSRWVALDHICGLYISQVETSKKITHQK